MDDLVEAIELLIEAKIAQSHTPLAHTSRLADATSSVDHAKFILACALEAETKEAK